MRNIWKKLRYFSPEENWGDPERIHPRLLILLDSLRDYIGCPIIIHCGTQGKHAKNSYHYRGMAADCHAEGIDLLDFYLAAERFNFTGIGIYPYWNNPGLHLDVHPRHAGQPQARWGRVDREYIPLDGEFIIRVDYPFDFIRLYGNPVFGKGDVGFG